LKFRKLEFPLGLIIGLLTPIFAFAMVQETYPMLKKVEEYEELLFKDIVFKVASIGLVLNAAWFFLFLRFGGERLSKGVLYACLAYVFGLIVYKFVL
jgi:hypothetical protein